MQLTTNTYAAYNFWGGRSLYAYHSMERLRASRVSFDRPGLGYYGHSTFERWERQFVQWAEANGIALEYACNYDLEAHREILACYSLVIGVGHDEYWSGPMRTNAEAYVAAGGNFALFSGNSVCWQVRFDIVASKPNQNGLSPSFATVATNISRKCLTMSGWRNKVSLLGQCMAI